MLRGSRAGAGGREFAGFESVDGGVRGIFRWVRSFEHRDDGSQVILMLQLVIGLGFYRSGVATIGDEYRAYMKRTVRLLPRIKRGSE